MMVLKVYQKMHMLLPTAVNGLNVVQKISINCEINR